MAKGKIPIIIIKIFSEISADAHTNLRKKGE